MLFRWYKQGLIASNIYSLYKSYLTNNKRSKTNYYLNSFISFYNNSNKLKLIYEW